MTSAACTIGVFIIPGRIEFARIPDGVVHTCGLVNSGHRPVRPKTVTQTGLARCLAASATTTLRKTQDPLERAARYGAKMSIPIGKPVCLQRMHSRWVSTWWSPGSSEGRSS